MNNTAWKPIDVPNDAVLLRRIHPGQFNYESCSVWPAVFGNDEDSDSHSVDWEEHTSQEKTLIGHESFGVLAVTAKDYRALSQAVNHTPDQAQDNYGHCDAVGQKTARVKKNLRKVAELRVCPEKLEDPTPKG